MIYVKVTGGYIRQTFDTELGKFTSESFGLSDYDCPEWENEDGSCLEENFWDGKEFGPYGPYLEYPTIISKYQDGGGYCPCHYLNK